MQRGTALMAFGVLLIIMGILALKLTDRNLFWGLIALGAGIGASGGVQVSQRARP
jgi:hypothetical protein